MVAPRGAVGPRPVANASCCTNADGGGVGHPALLCFALCLLCSAVRYAVPCSILPALLSRNYVQAHRVQPLPPPLSLASNPDADLDQSAQPFRTPRAQPSSAVPFARVSAFGGRTRGGCVRVHWSGLRRGVCTVRPCHRRRRLWQLYAARDFAVRGPRAAGSRTSRSFSVWDGIVLKARARFLSWCATEPCWRLAHVSFGGRDHARCGPGGSVHVPALAGLRPARC